MSRKAAFKSIINQSPIKNILKLKILVLLLVILLCIPIIIQLTSMNNNRSSNSSGDKAAKPIISNSYKFISYNDAECRDLKRTPDAIETYRECTGTLTLASENESQETFKISNLTHFYIKGIEHPITDLKTLNRDSYTLTIEISNQETKELKNIVAIPTN